MKKVLALFLALMMVLSLFTACAKQETTTTAEPTPAETEQKPNRPQKKHPLPPAKTSSSISWAHSILTRPSPI